MEFVLSIHSLVRYVVLLAAGIGLIKAVMNLGLKNLSQAADPILATIFLGLFDLQAFLGILVIFLGGLRGPLHPLLMFIALVIAHVIGTSVKRGASANLNWLRLALYSAPLAIILVALLIIDKLKI